jgi:hypothetical protein
MHIIWTNELDYKDWKDDLESQYPNEEGFTDQDREQFMYEINDEYLEEEKANLNKELGRKIIVFANLGLWYGNRQGYAFLKSTNLNAIFSNACGDYNTWYVEGEDIKCKDTHHDGTNRYIYRLLKEEYDEDDFYGHHLSDVMKEMTEPLGEYVAKVYGFKINKSGDK